MKNSSKDTMVIFGDIDINSKVFEISEPINLNEELDIDNSYIFSDNNLKYSDNIYFDVFKDEKNINTLLKGVLEININTKKLIYISQMKK
ncbi:hypothetical protein CYK68_02385 [Clostridium perfringens]|nr:hypothetical protein CYK68_02385 [Clostridium perfringens]